ncbi:hypothetical protein BXZ70DRAFT_918593 [Cristinia sonorae]|uniref:Uncharacterized protein n=1 Tax=Cristinia sonorae TaxID=1940300 RepID=A0A8K0UWF2_9AGAR|nr:hypothetical protein BXZ70DRAFT_918593 [Cristinia sonorae]
MAASTKPTTLLSIDLTGGMAHIAQAPPTPTVPAHRIPPHTRTHSTGVSSGGSITFSLLPPASPSRPTSSSHGQMPSVSSRVQGQASLQAPQHTTHHPRNNPRPSSPPPDDASVLTLASSAFGFPGARAGAFGRSGRTSVADDSISHFSHPHGGGDSTSQFLLGDGDADDDRTYEERYTYGDVDASVRALRPRSSRRGSWESEASGWSARLTGAQAGTSVNPKERSILTNGSQKTGARSVQTEDGEADAEDKTKDMHVENESKPAKYGPNASESFKAEVSDNVLVVTPSTDATSPPETPSAASVSAPADKLLETPKGTPLTLDDAPVVPQHLDAASLAQA